MLQCEREYLCFGILSRHETLMQHSLSIFFTFDDMPYEFFIFLIYYLKVGDYDKLIVLSLLCNFFRVSFKTFHNILNDNMQSRVGMNGMRDGGGANNKKVYD